MKLPVAIFRRDLCFITHQKFMFVVFFLRLKLKTLNTVNYTYL